MVLAGCSSLAPRAPHVPDREPSKPVSGGYYKDDGPGANPPADLAGIPDAVPREEPLHRYANRPYSALGREFTPLKADSAYRATGPASWYGRRFHGKPTASGEVYDMYAMTAAHPTLPIPSYVRVSNPANGRSVVVRINDRGPFHEDRLIDLSYTAAWKLDLLRGVRPVQVERIFAGDLPTTPGAAVPGLWLQLAALSRREAAEALVRQVRETELTLPGLALVESDALVKVQAGPYASTGDQVRADAERIERVLGMRPIQIWR